MASKQPIAGRCGSPLSGGRGFCTQYPLKDAARCGSHGGQQQKKGRPDLRKTGTQSVYMRGIQAETQAEIDRAIKDPSLLDVRRSVALSAVVLGEANVFPSDETLHHLGKVQWMRGLGVKVIERLLDNEGPEYFDDPENIPEVYVELARRAYMQRSQAMVEKHGKTQMAALKQIEVGRLMREQTIPLFVEMGLRLGRLIDYYVAEKDRKAFMTGFRNDCRAVVADLGTLKDVKANK